MKKKLILFLLLLFAVIFAAPSSWASCSNSGSSIICVQSKTSSGTTSVGVAYTTNPGLNSLLICIEESDAVSNGTTLGACTDTIGNSWTLGPAVTLNNDGQSALYYAVNSSNAADTVTCHTTSGHLVICSIFEITGIVTSSPLDASGTVTNAGSTGSLSVSTSGSVAQANEYVIACFVDWNGTNSWTAGSGYTIEETRTNNVAIEDNNTRTGLSGVQTATGTKTSTTTGYIGLIATFKGTGGAATPLAVNKRQKIEQMDP